LCVTAGVKTRKVGGAVVVTISKEVVEVVEIKEEESIRIEIEKQRTKYVGALKGIGKFNRKERTDHRDG
jgi:antitoxin component of MazEF toxin-antitoxin module